MVAAVIERDGRYLIARRREAADLGGYWEFPGGKCRPGETLEACLQREVREELGVEIRVNSLIDRAVHEYPHGRVDLRFFHATLAGGTPSAIGCAEIRWVTPGELAAYRFPPANDSLLRKLASP